MTSSGVKDQAVSIRHRLRNLAAERQEESGFVLTRYAVQRLLHRLSRSEFRDRFLLKGATLFAVWSDRPHRPTRDLDLLGFGDNDIAAVQDVFRTLCSTYDPEDGLGFVPESVQGRRIRGGQEYQGVRLTLLAMLGKTRIPLQVDVGFGDDVYPAPDEIEVPGLIGLPSARVWAYPRETVVAEKLQAMVELGIANSRMKDFYDLWMLAREFPFSGATLVESVRRTFVRRRTSIPSTVPLALSEEFAADRGKTIQWVAFLRKSGLGTGSDLEAVIQTLAVFLLPVLGAASHLQPLDAIWPQGGPWKSLHD